MFSLFRVGSPWVRQGVAACYSAHWSILITSAYCRRREIPWERLDWRLVGHTVHWSVSDKIRHGASFKCKCIEARLHKAYAMRSLLLREKVMRASGCNAGENRCEDYIIVASNTFLYRHFLEKEIDTLNWNHA